MSESILAELTLLATADLAATLAALGHDGAGWWLRMSLWTGALLAAALLADHLLRRRVAPAWRAVLYLAVFVRAALPVDWSAPLSPLAAAPASTTTVEEVAPATTNDGAALEALAAPALLGAPALPAPPAEGPSLSPLPLALGLVYLLGALALLGAGVRARRRLRATIAEARPARPELAALAPELTVLEHAEAGPFACGVLRRRVVLPARLLGALAPDELACVVAHERAHHRRRDPLQVFALSLVTAALWPLLPIWIAAARLRQLMELSADELALRLGRTDARRYGETLLKLAELPAVRSPLATAVGLEPGGVAEIRRRLLALRGGARLPAAAQAGVAVAIGSLALACAGAGEPIADERCEEPVDARLAEPAADCVALKRVATTQHDRSERADDPDAREQALAAYDRYAASCARDQDHAEMLYYRAELLWAAASRLHASGDETRARAAFDRARGAFEQALAAKPGGFTEDAAYAQLLATMNALGLETRAAPGRRGDGSRDAGGAFPITDYSGDERRLLRSGELFARYVDDPENEGTQLVLYTRARLASEHNRFDEAERHARALLDSSDGEALHVWAAQILTDVLTIRMADEAAPDAAREAAADDLLAWLTRAQAMALYQRDEAASLRDAVSPLTTGAMWVKAEVANAAGRHAECGARFAALIDRAPEHPQLDDAMINAARCWSASGDRARAREHARALLRRAPGSEHAREARTLAR